MPFLLVLLASAGLAPSAHAADAPAPPWLRARVSGVVGSYRYEQRPSEVPGPVLPAILAVGRPLGGAAARPTGGEVDVRAWADALGTPYVGLHARFRATGYRFAVGALETVLGDALAHGEVNLLGRVPIPIAGNQVWIGGSVGLHGDDLLLFTGCLEPGCTVLFEQLVVTGLGLGFELGADVGRAHLVGGVDVGLASGVEPYRAAVDLESGYEFLDHVYAEVGLSMVSRSVYLQGADSLLRRGEISDDQIMVKLGIGVAL